MDLLPRVLTEAAQVRGIAQRIHPDPRREHGLRSVDPVGEEDVGVSR